MDLGACLGASTIDHPSLATSFQGNHLQKDFSEETHEAVDGKVLLKLEKLVKNYPSMRALNGVDLEITSGITGLLGPNGAGKSTLIKILLGLVKVTSGQATFLGFRVGSETHKIRSRVGYMPEDDCYIPGMSGIKVVQFAACLAGIPPVEAFRRAHEILDFCGMKQERYRTIETFSTGMRQKTKFAAAIVHDPDFLILDEPTSGLDPEEREAMLNRIDILSKNFGKSVMLSTHILPDVQAICDQVVILSKGQVKMNRPMAELRKRTSPAVTIRVAGDADEFSRIMTRAGIPNRVIEGQEIEFETQDDEQLAPVWQLAEQTRTAIISVEPAQNSLEEIFIRTVQEADQHAHS